MPVKKNSKLKSQISPVPGGEKPQLKTKKMVKKIAVKKTAKKDVVEAKVAVAKPAKEKSLSVSVVDIKGKAAGTIDLPVEIFGAKINDSLMSQAVRVYLANQRQGTVKTKNRGEVDRTTKKIWQQKGTGRARHGSRRAPVFVGGGRVFGPRPRDLSLNLSRKMKTLALFSALSSKLKDREIKIVKGLEAIQPKTKLAAEVLENLGIKKTARVLLVMPKKNAESENVYRASRNIKGVEILSANMLNVYRVLDNELILLMKDSIGIFKDTFMKGVKE